MKGSYYFRPDVGWWVVQWYQREKLYKITRYKGERMYSVKTAKKVLALMQSDVEDRVFNIQKWIGQNWTDVIPYLNEWVEAIKDTLSPATYKDYRYSIKNHLIPFFIENPVQLHEIQYDVLMKLLTSINRTGKGKMNVMYCLHACLQYAWRSQRIGEMPPFPERKHYKIQETTPLWLPSERQEAVINVIPAVHQPIFWFLKYHFRRPGEAMALKRTDYDVVNKVFIIHRSVSARKVVDFTKTKHEHIVPCSPAFEATADKIAAGDTEYFFTCESSRSAGKRYTDTILNKLWNDAAAKCGEAIRMYVGTKHSSCSQFINECKGNLNDLQALTDHATFASVKKYATVELARKRELMAKIQTARNSKTTPETTPELPQTKKKGLKLVTSTDS